MENKRALAAALLFTASALAAVFWPLWMQAARPAVQEALSRQGFALTGEEQRRWEQLWER